LEKSAFMSSWSLDKKLIISCIHLFLSHEILLLKQAK